MTKSVSALGRKNGRRKLCTGCHLRLPTPLRATRSRLSTREALREYWGNCKGKFIHCLCSGLATLEDGSIFGILLPR